MASRAAQSTVPSQQTTAARIGATVLAIRWVFPSPRGQLSLLQAQRVNAEFQRVNFFWTSTKPRSPPER